jgi:hypothetical protein
MWKNIVTGLAVLALMLQELPLILMDGKVTLKEMCTLFEKVCAAAGWDLSFDVPANSMDLVIGATEASMLTTTTTNKDITSGVSDPPKRQG